MGREIRRVPVDFVHPYDIYGHLQGMFNQTLAEADEEWELELADWRAKGGTNMLEFVEDYGIKPSDDSGAMKAYYRPDDWPPEDERGWVVYQTVSEGSPVTPCFATKDELWFHLVNHGTDYDTPMSREAAQAFIDNGWVPTFIGSSNGIVSGLQSLEPGGALA